MTIRPPLLALVTLAGLSACQDRLEPGDDTASFVPGDRPPVGGGLSDDTGAADTGDDTGAADTDTGPLATEACYLGADRDGDACLAVVAATTAGADYDYPDPLQGSANYRAPVAYLDLQALDPATKLAPNFRLDEFAQASKGRYAVVQPHLVDSVQSLRDDLGPIVVNSGYRSPGYNDGVDGSATYSRHMYGDAADLDPVDASLSTLQAACNTAGAGYVGVYTTHMHCDWRNVAVDEAFFGPAGRARPRWADLPDHTAWIVDDGRELAAPAVGWDEGEPLRQWFAYDAAGTLIATETAETFEPPPEADEVVVVVGLVLERRVRLGEL